MVGDKQEKTNIEKYMMVVTKIRVGKSLMQVAAWRNKEETSDKSSLLVGQCHLYVKGSVDVAYMFLKVYDPIGIQ